MVRQVKFKNVNNSTFFIHRQTGRLPFPFATFRGHSFFSWIEKNILKVSIQRGSPFMCFSKDSKRLFEQHNIKQCAGEKFVYNVIEAILFSDKYSFLKEIKKTYIFIIISLPF